MWCSLAANGSPDPSVCTFVQSETFCDACHSWSWRSYVDPEFLLPEVHEKLLWQKMLAQQPSRAQPLRPVSAA